MSLVDTLSSPLLHIKHLQISVNDAHSKRLLVDDVNLQIHPGEAVGLVGESGCGKSLTALSVINLLPKPTLTISGGEIIFQDTCLNKAPASTLQHLRGNRIAMIFQDPMTALNPVHRIGDQIAEVIQLHQPDATISDIQRRCLELCDQVKIASAQERLNSYPHELSGGLRQRVVIAMALACKPDLLIADEPTTALDVTVQSQILHLLKELQRAHKMALLFISHDLGVIGQLCDRVAVMYAGRIIEEAPVHDLLHAPQHPYTQGLIQAIPRLTTQPKTRLTAIPGMVSKLDVTLPGCNFVNRCAYSKAHCHTTRPELQALNTDTQHYTACHEWQHLTVEHTA